MLIYFSSYTGKIITFYTSLVCFFPTQMNTASLFSTVVDVCQRYIHHHYMFPIWNPLWRSIQDPHVSSLHMSTPKKETRLPLQSIAKTETRCNTHTGSSLLMATVCVRMTAENLHEDKGNIHCTFCF